MSKQKRSFHLAAAFVGVCLILSLCSGQTLAVVSGTNIQVSPDSVDFGGVEINLTVDSTITISNTSAIDLLVIDEITLASDPIFTLPAFAFTSSITLGASQDTSFIVRFGPLASVAYNDTIRITSDDDSLPIVKIPLSGTGGVPDIFVLPDSVDFGPVAVGDTVSTTVFVSNVGGDTLFVSSVTTVNATVFIPSLSTFDVAPDSTFDLLVSYVPSGVGIEEDTLSIASDDPDESLVEVALSGEGVVLGPDIAVTPDSIEVTMDEGVDSTFAVTVSNTGQGSLDFTIKEGFLNVVTTVGGPSAAGAGVHDPPGPVPPLRKDNTVSLALFQTLVSTLSDSVVIFIDDMESGINGWTTELLEGTTDDLWHQTETNANTPTHSWWCALETPGDYDTGSRISNALISPSIGLSGAQIPIALEFFENYNTEPGFDRCMVEVTIDGGATWIPLRDPPSGDSGGWIKTSLDLSEFVGEQIQIRFLFDTGDGDFNSFPGWFVDDVIVHAGSADVPWLSAVPDAGSVSSSGSLPVAVTVNTDGLPPGNHDAELIFVSNDPDESPLKFPVHVTVSSAQDIGVPTAEVNFGQVALGDTSTVLLILKNVGTASLNVSSITTGSPGIFIPSPSSVTLAPSDSVDLVISYTPSSANTERDTVSIVSDDPDEGLVEIPLLGRGVLPPDISLAPDSIEVTLIQGDDSTLVVTVSNTGAGPLNFEIEEGPLNGADALGGASASGADVHLPSVFVPELQKDNIVSLALYNALVSTLSDSVVIFSDDMEGGVNGWTTEVFTVDDLWHQTNSNFNTPTTSWWCGDENTGTYDTGNPIRNALISPDIDLGNFAAPITLEFFENYNTEPGWDRCMVDVTTDGGTTWVPLRGVPGPPNEGTAPSGDSGGWIKSILDLSAFEGQLVQIRFFFDTTDGAVNAFPGWFVDDVVVHAGVVDVPWLSADPDAGSVPASGSLPVSVTLDATGLPAGDHDAKLIFKSNDPDEDLLDFPVHLTVLGAPDIDPDPVDVNFGQVVVGDTATVILNVANLGSDSLRVSSITTTGPGTTFFSLPSGALVPPLSVPPIDPNAPPDGPPLNVLPVLVSFAPSGLGIDQDSLSIVSNDPDETLVQIPLRGEGVTAPDIAVAPTQVDLALTSGDIVQVPLTVSNVAGAGAQDLVVKVSDRRPEIDGVGLDPGAYQGGGRLSRPLARAAPGPSTGRGASLAQQYKNETFYGDKKPDASLRKPASETLPGIPFIGPFNNPLSIAFDPVGNLFVGTADGDILKALPDGTVIPFVGGLGFPLALAFDPDGFLYVADNSTSTIFRIAPDATVVPFAVVDGFPTGLAFGALGNLFVATEVITPDGFIAGAILRITPDGVVIPFVPDLPDAFGIAFDNAGNLLVTTFGVGEILIIDPEGTVDLFASPGPFLEGIAIDVEGKVYVGNGFFDTVDIYNPDGTFDSTLTNEVTGFPINLAFGFVPDGVNNINLFVSNGDFFESPFQNQVVFFEVGVPGLPLPPTGVPWLSEFPDLLTIPPGADSVVTLTINTVGLPGGLHEALVVLDSNDPDQPTVEVPVSLTLAGAPAISVTPDNLEFDDQFIGGSKVLALQVKNVGSDLLSVTDIGVDLADYIVSPPIAFDLPPLSAQQVTVTFTPQVPGPRVGALSITSNDLGEPVVNVPLSGAGVVAPSLVLDPLALDVSLPPDGSTTGSISIANGGSPGASDLDFTLEIVYLSNTPTGAGVADALGAGPPASPPQANRSSSADRAPGEILVKFQPGTQNAYVREVNRTLGASTLRVFSSINVHHLKIDSGASVDQMLEAYRNNTAVVYAEPNYIVNAEQFIPNDPLFPDLWGLHNIGQAAAGCRTPTSTRLRPGKSSWASRRWVREKVSSSG